MESDLLDGLIRANLAASAAILAILLIRTFVARRLGARVAYALWLAVPVAALGSLLPARRIVQEAVPEPASTAVARSGAVAVRMAGRVLLEAPSDPAALAIQLWLVGAAAFLVVLAWRQLRFSRSLGRLSPEAGMFRSERAGVGPAVVGALRPRIVLPADFEARFSLEERAFVLDHERTHLRRGDPLVNTFLALVQCVAWFNPLIHLAAFHVRLDQELACDATVVGRRPEARRAYAEAMLKTQLAPAAVPLGCHWPARGARPLRQRIAMLASAPPSAAGRVVGAVLAGALSLAAGVAAWAAQPPRMEMAAAAVGPAAFTGPAPRVRSTTARPAAPRAVVVADAAPRLTRAASNDRPDVPRRLSAYLSRDLLRAAAHDEPDVAEALIAAGADVDFHQPGDGTALLEAAKRDHVATMRVLLAHGADVNKASPGDGNALIRAARAGQLRAAQLLVEHGADVNAYVWGDETPLIGAARSDDLRMVQFLVDNGADVNLAVRVDPWGSVRRSPLTSASSPAVKAYLRAHGAQF